MRGVFRVRGRGPGIPYGPIRVLSWYCFLFCVHLFVVIAFIDVLFYVMTFF